MIELRKIKEEVVDRFHEQHQLVIDGEILEQGDRIRIGVGLPRGVHIAVLDAQIAQKIISHRFNEIPSNLTFNLYAIPPLRIDEDIRSLLSIKHGESGTLSMSFSTTCAIVRWKHPWSIAEFISEYSFIAQTRIPPAASVQKNDIGLRFWDDELDEEQNTSASIDIEIPSINSLIRDEFIRYADLVNELIEATKASLTAKLRSDSVVVYFDFPEEVRAPCEQYLIYFIQFLKDLGVEATAELQHEAGQVLFAVTPTNKDEALDKIRAALDTYLHLAASPVNSASVLSTDIEVQRLSANIQHLQGQLTLAHAVLQAKDATIQLQQTTIAQQRQMLTGEIVLESMKDVTPRPKDSEEVLGGLAEITKYEGKGFNLNLPEAFRRLRKVFSEKKGGNR